MNKNDIVTVEITDIGVSGEGIGHVDGYTLFIKDAVIGDVVEAKVMKAKKNYGYARLMKVITPSEYRVEPKCAFARRCGGCQIQEMSYDRQLLFKDQKIRGNLERIGGFTKDQIDTVMQPVVGMEHPFGYRNKAQFPFGTDKEGNQIKLLDIVESGEPELWERVVEKKNILRLYELLPKVLDERESWIIRRRYGLYNTKPATQREIAKGLGISRSYVSRIEKKALEKLRQEFVDG